MRMQDVHPEAGDRSAAAGAVPLDEYAHIFDVSITPEEDIMEPNGQSVSLADDYEITDEGDDDEGEALSQPEARLVVDLSPEDTKKLGRLLAGPLVARAAQWGVPMTPDQAQRAGELVFGIRTVDPKYERRQGHASGSEDERPPETPPEDQDTNAEDLSAADIGHDDSLDDESPPRAAGGDSGNNGPPEGPPPPESSAPLPEDGDDPAMEPAPEPQESAADAPPEHTPHSENDPEPRRRYAPGQLREELRNLNTILSEGGVDAQSFLMPREREALPLLLDPELKPADVAEQLGVSVAQVSKTNRIILERLIANAPEGAIPPEVAPQPKGSVISDPPAGVGPALNALRQERGIPVDHIAEVLERSPSVIGRFLRGETHPNASSILGHILDVLGVTGEEAARYTAEYQSERKAMLAERNRRFQATKAQRKITEPEE
jgi:transcriptional regulator with XRE-family HTH domain